MCVCVRAYVCAHMFCAFAYMNACMHVLHHVFLACMHVCRYVCACVSVRVYDVQVKYETDAYRTEQEHLLH